MADLTGQTLGKYRLVERLGRGGMAEVYKAYQPRLDRYVAVKVMHGYLAEDEGFVERFQREAKAIAALHHPHIVQVHDFDIEGDLYYMVQEFVSGGTLKARLKKASEQGKPIPIEETLRVLSAICDAVDYAHQQGRIHRDIKPDNVMFDDRDRPVLTDFGIASIVGGTRLTATGAMVGTPAYMSPEQGKGYPGDGRSDVYSLGVVLYEMVTGRVPFDADTPFAVVLKHVNEPLPMPRTLNPDVPPAVERVILKALAKDPEDRYQTARELADALQNAVSEMAMPVWEMPADLAAVPEVADLATPEAVPAASELPPIPTAASVSAVAAPLQPPKVEVAAPPSEPAPASAAQVAAAETPALAPTAAPTRPKARVKGWQWALIGLAGFIFLACCLLASARALRQIGTRAKATQAARTPVATLTAAATRVDKGKAVQAAAPPPGDLSTLIQSGNDRLSDKCEGDVVAALAIFEQAVAQYPDRPEGYIGRARCRICSKESEAALADLGKALEVVPDYAPAYYWRGRLWMDQEKGPEALADLTKAIELDPAYMEAYYHRGLVSLWLVEDPDLALADMSKVIELAPDFAPAYQYRSRAYAAKDNAQAALADLTRYIELQPDNPDGYAERGSLYVDYLQDYEKAVQDYDLAIEREADRADLYYRRAWAYYLWGKFDRAMEDWDRSIQLEPSVETYFDRGMARYQLGQYEAALEDFDQVLTIGWDHAGAAHYGKGWTYYALGRYGEAVGAYNEAARYEWDSYAWPFFVDTDLRLDRAKAYRENGDPDKALSDLDALIGERGDWAPAYLERALTYRALGRPVQALQDLRQAWKYADKEELRAQIEKEIEQLRGAGEPEGGTPAQPDCASPDAFCVGLVTDIGSIDDRSFNQYTWEGVRQAEKELGAVIDYIETASSDDYRENIARFADAGYDVIVTVGFALSEDTRAAGAKYPDVQFIGVDQYQSPGQEIGNVVGLVFPEDQVGFLAGALAAMMSESGKVGAVLGPDTVPPVWRFGEGYRAGARYVNPDVEVETVYHNDVDPDKAFTDPEWGKATALSLIERGFDVIMGAGGPTGDGALLACAQEDVLAIGVDIDQYYTVPEAQPVLLTSATKLLGPGTFALIKLARENAFPAGGNYMGEIGLAPYHDLEEDVPQEVKDEVAALAQALRDGELETGVPTSKP